MKKKGKRGRPAPESTQADLSARAEAAPIDRWQTILLAAMVALLVARPLVPEDPGGENGYGAPFNVLWLVLACAWFLGQMRRGEFRLRFGWPDALALALVAWHTISALVAFHVGSPRPAINMLWEWIGLGATFVLVRQVIHTTNEARAVIVVMLGLAIGLSAVAVHQYYVTIPGDLSSYEAAKDSTESLYSQTGQWMPPGSSARQQFENRLNSRLPGATFALSNSLAGFLVPWCVILFAITLAARRPATLAAGIASLALMAGCIFLTGSRSGGAAIIAGCLLVVADSARSPALSISWRRAFIPMLSAIAIAAFAVSVGTSTGREALAAAERSVSFRFEYWRATLAMIRDYPLLGCGPGQFQDYYATYKLPGASEVVQDPHNWLLDVWANAGTPGAILLIAFLTATIVRAWRAGGNDIANKDEIRRSPRASNAAAATASDAAVFGGVAGVALGTAIAWLSGFPLARMHMLLVVAGIVGAWWIWRGWAQAGALAKRLPLVATIALLVNLLAAGGISYPGVAGSLWLLLAIELNLTEGASYHADEVALAGSFPARTATLFRSKIARWAAGMALAAMLAIAIWTEYLPVMACRLQLSIADAGVVASRADQSRDALVAAVAADPWSPEAAARLAEQRFADYQALPTPTQRRSLLEADALARQLAPRHSGVWAQSADFAAAIHEHTSSVEDLDAADRYFERAIELFPSHAELLAKAANFWQSVGKLDRAREAAVEAIRVDDLMRAGGHTDRELRPAVREATEAIAHLPIESRAD
jgi:hypothetical protein